MPRCEVCLPRHRFKFLNQLLLDKETNDPRLVSRQFCRFQESIALDEELSLTKPENSRTKSASAMSLGYIGFSAKRLTPLIRGSGIALNRVARKR